MLLAAGCTTRYEPVIDTQYVDPRGYQADLADCRKFAEHVNPAEDAAIHGAIGAAIGAATFAAIGAVVGIPGTGAAIGAISGGSSGATRGAYSSVEKKHRIVRNCLKGRGYSVLD